MQDRVILVVDTLLDSQTNEAHHDPNSDYTLIHCKGSRTPNSRIKEVEGVLLPCYNLGCHKPRDLDVELISRGAYTNAKEYLENLACMTWTFNLRDRKYTLEPS